MFRAPDIDDVQEVAAALGFPLSAQDAAVFRTQLAQQLHELDDFLQSRTPEVAPPRYPGAREPGHRPSSEDDPLGSWTWRCHVEGAPEGLLQGRTVSYKDHVAVAGIPMSLGTFVLDGHVPGFDATIVSRALEAGATVVGKNVMNGLGGGYGFGGGVGDYGRPRNPHQPDHLTGGSSSGSAGAVVTGEVDISFGGDQGGSIRIPASWSGCVGLKPTFGLVSHFGIGFGSDQSIDFTGPMAMSVEDVARALDAVAGQDGLDPRQGPGTPRAYDSLTGLDEGVAGLRVGILEEGYLDADADVVDAVDEAVEVLAGLGATVTKVSVPAHLATGVAQQALSAEGSLAVLDTLFYGTWAKTYYPADTIAAVTEAYAHHRLQLDPRSVMQHVLGTFARRYWSGRLYAKSQNVRPLMVQAYDDALATVDVLVMPTTPTQAPRYEEPAREDRLAMALQGATTYRAVQNTRPFNFTGHPALAVPTAKRNGLSASMQLVGRMHDDALLLRVAQAYTAAVPFAEHVAIGG
ncbi:MAG: amidase [Cellulomonas sp.]|uniref:amidase family protein n=1 Tax=Cellulomonas sp. TaxID=40001 RepID=UPI0019DD15A4|nr:amidase family protein [Cellulomonas sp.]MBF0688384.1 amidase [Cellulomonas sp.]